MNPNRIGDVFKKMLEEMEENAQETLIGKVSEEIRQKYHSLASELAKVKLKEIELQLSRQQIWIEIANELGVDPITPMRIDPATGEVFRCKKADE